MWVIWLACIFIFLCWGSFLNAFSYRIIHNYSIIWPRSFCPKCKKTIAWYDLIPVISWIMLRAKCRSCKQKISLLYPFIELSSAIIFTSMLFMVPPRFWLSTFILFSALIVTIRTDFETMLISRIVTLWLIPLAWLFSYFNLLEISLLHSLLGGLFGYLLLWSVAKIFFLIKNEQGMGEGDFELLAMIGSFIGLYGAWFSVFIGACLGSLLGLYLYLNLQNLKSIKIPFGPWLAFGAIFYKLFSSTLIL